MLTHRYKSIIVIDTIICQSKGGEFFVKPLLNYMCIYTIIRYKIGIFIYGFNLKFESIYMYIGNQNCYNLKTKKIDKNVYLL